MKVIAYYLPQFHEIEENNKWWGKGFTEWTNIKKAQPLFNGHQQPFEPLNDNYYDLMNKETVQWQADLADKYDIYGFCYYHYWFEGRKILEKPAENLLKWKEISKRFCFCWANHSWKKTWNGTMEMLIEQNYGGEEEWEEHFQYLKDFFLDERYIKIDNKPVIMVFLPEDITNYDERIMYYDRKCKELGFDGIYIVESINNSKSVPFSSKSDAVTLREPNIGVTSSSFIKRSLLKIKREYNNRNLLKPMDFKYEEICNNSIQFAKTFKSDKRVFLGGFTGWDSTPRHGRRGYIISGNTPEKFFNYLCEQKKLLQSNNEEFIFINAWNEWAEGMFLEPDKKNSYKYLEAIKKAQIEE